MVHKAGFVNIVGLPNVGKSTLMNALVGERMSIISPKAQTTRHRILGIVNEEDYQIVFSDTPGFINQPHYKLHQSMNDFVHQSFEDADVIVFVTDKYQKPEEQAFLFEHVSKTTTPALLLINKSDLYYAADLEVLKKEWQAKLPNAFVFDLSALNHTHIQEVKDKIVSLLPESPPYYDKDELTDRSMRFFVAEIVREKIFLNYSKEIPYSCQVFVEEYKEEEKMDRIRCLIYVERESQKSIVIGKGGEMLNKVGREARIDIEAFIGKKVFLDLFVKVKDNWRNNELTLRSFGY